MITATHVLNSIGGGGNYTIVGARLPPRYFRHRTVRSSAGRSDPDDDDDDDENGQTQSKGRGFSIDWDKAWSRFKKKGKKTLFSQFGMEKYVTRDPTRIEYPLSKETDPYRKAEKSALRLWTSSKFTVIGLSIVLGLFILYSVLYATKHL